MDRFDWLDIDRLEAKVDIYLLPQTPKESGKDLNNLSCLFSNIITFPTKITWNTYVYCNLLIFSPTTFVQLLYLSSGYISTYFINVCDKNVSIFLFGL